MRRNRIFFIIIAFAFIVLFARLFFLQIIRGEFFRRKSENNRIQTIKDVAPRGLIYDCNGRIIVDNRPSFCVSIIPWLAKRNPDEVLRKLSSLIEINVDDVKAKILNQKFRPFQPIFLAQDVSPLVISKIYETQMDFYGVIVQPVALRVYPQGSLCAHILGYTQEINEEDFEKLKDQGYEQGDFIGRAGIEKVYEQFLKGIDGGTEIEVDVLGRPSSVPRVIAKKEAIKGADVVLTINKDIQLVCEKALTGRSGAIVVMDPSNGEIVAIASRPSFDPAIFMRSMPSWEWERILNDRRHPFLNRALQGNYSPGSVFKIITAVAALENNEIDPDRKVECEGKVTLGNRVYKCWKKEGHGSVNFLRGLSESCDVYFYQLGLRVGPEEISRYASLFGLGARTGIDIEGEKKGLVPSPGWKKKFRGEKWFKGDTFNFAIGQGYLLSTPLQLANMISAVFNGGKLYQLRLAREVRFNDGTRNVFEDKLISQINLNSSTITVLSEALHRVLTDGTGRLADIPQAVIYGKTGSAQNPSGKAHAWFACYASPIQGKAKEGTRPLALCVFVENGGEGGGVACPIAGSILSQIYGPDEPPYPKEKIAVTSEQETR